MIISRIKQYASDEDFGLIFMSSQKNSEKPLFLKSLFYRILKKDDGYINSRLCALQFTYATAVITDSVHKRTALTC